MEMWGHKLDTHLSEHIHAYKLRKARITCRWQMCLQGKRLWRANIPPVTNVHTSIGLLSGATSAHLIWEWKLAWFHFARSLNSRKRRKPGHLLKVGWKTVFSNRVLTIKSTQSIPHGHASEGTKGWELIKAKGEFLKQIETHSYNVFPRFKALLIP